MRCASPPDPATAIRIIDMSEADDPAFFWCRSRPEIASELEPIITHCTVTVPSYPAAATGARGLHVAFKDVSPNDVRVAYHGLSPIAA